MCSGFYFEVEFRKYRLRPLRKRYQAPIVTTVENFNCISMSKLDWTYHKRLPRVAFLQQEIPHEHRPQLGKVERTRIHPARCIHPLVLCNRNINKLNGDEISMFWWITGTEAQILLHYFSNPFRSNFNSILKHLILEYLKKMEEES